MFDISGFWASVQRSLFPYLQETLPPGSLDRLRDLILVLEVVRVEQHVPASRFFRGRKPADRRALARAFVAKAWSNLPHTKSLRERLLVDAAWRQVCGWERRQDVPSESTFSRAFAELAHTGLLDRCHAAAIARFAGDTLFWHVARDSTAIAARERPGRPSPASPAPASPIEQTTRTETAPEAPRTAPPQPAATPPKRGRGRPRKGERPAVPEPTRLERQYATPLAQTAALLGELPTTCDRGTKLDAKGNKLSWQGYKFHVDVGDTGLPLLALTTSASLHDSQVAIPMARLTAQRVTAFYELMDAAYDAQPIRNACHDLQHVPIIEENPRRGPKRPLEPDRARRYHQRTASERFNSDLKDNHGGRTVRVRGQPKVHAHLMFGLLVIFANVVLGWT